jgi:transketolase
MRNNIIQALIGAMEKDEKIFFLTADMGINLVEPIEQKFPARFANVGIAEQNLISVAAGLANLGFKPFVYTISNFVIHRCFEQIRNDVILHQYPVVLMGTSTGYDNAPLGPTHHIIDDWGTLRSLPGIDIYCPSSVAYAETLVNRVIKENKPAYIRIPKGEFTRPDTTEDIELVEGRKKDTLLISYGSPAQECLKVMDAMDNVSVLVFNRLIPLHKEKLQKHLTGFRRYIVVEDQFASAGLYGLLCEFINTSAASIHLESIAPSGYVFDVGKSNSYFHKKFGFSSEALQNFLAS